MIPDFLEALEVIAHLLINLVGRDLARFAVLEVPPPVEHPRRDLEVERVLDDTHNVVHLLCGQLARALVHVNLRLLADDVGEAAPHTLDVADGVHHLLLAINVGAKKTQDVLEIGTVLDRERLKSNPQKVRQSQFRPCIMPQ